LTVRFIVLTLALLFIAAMTFLTVRDFVNNGVTGLGVVGAVVVAIVGIGIIGAFLERPPEAKRRRHERPRK
jgi:uncharacterized membrane-anchored protein